MADETEVPVDWDAMAAELEAAIFDPMPAIAAQTAPSTLSSLEEVYDAISIEKKVRLTFANAKSKEQFRTALAKHKERTEKRQINLGMISSSQVEKLSCKKVSTAEDSHIYEFCLSGPKGERARKDYFTFAEVVSSDDN